MLSQQANKHFFQALLYYLVSIAILPPVEPGCRVSRGLGSTSQGQTPSLHGSGLLGGHECLSRAVSEVDLNSGISSTANLGLSSGLQVVGGSASVLAVVLSSNLLQPEHISILVELVISFLAPLDRRGSGVCLDVTLNGIIGSLLDLLLLWQGHNGSMKHVQVQLSLSNLAKTIVSRADIAASILEGDTGDGVLEVGVDEASAAGPLDSVHCGLGINAAFKLSSLVLLDL